MSGNTCKLPSIQLLLLDLPMPRVDQFYPVYHPPYPMVQSTEFSAPVRPQIPCVAYPAQPPSGNYSLPIPILSYSERSSTQPESRPPSLVGSVSAPSDGSVANTTPGGSPVAQEKRMLATPNAHHGLHTPKTASPRASYETNCDGSVNGDHSSVSRPTLPQSPKDSWKPRRRKQCPDCHLYFSNLATHKSTHLKPTNRPHLCKLCQRGFARPNDLLRHFKCHWKEIGADKGQFRCPFKHGPNGDHCCHSLGIFSRCDTYKNHLKAIHFRYPQGTRKSQRNHVPGQCGLCREHFSNVDEWINKHINTKSCPFAN